MDIESRKTRVKILRRILNSLTVEISQLRSRGETDTGDLELARQAISRFCDKLWPVSPDSSESMFTSNPKNGSCTAEDAEFSRENRSL